VTPATSGGRGAGNLTIGQLLCAFAYASDIAFGLQLEDSVRSCYLAFRLAERMGLSDAQCRAAYYTALLRDAGCTSWTSELASAWETDEIVARRELATFGNRREMKYFLPWMRRFVARDASAPRKLARYANVLITSRGFFSEGFTTTVRVSARIASRLGMPPDVQEALLSVFEQWDGRGAPNGLAGAAIPTISRIVQPTFSLVPFHRVGGRDAAVEVAEAFRGRAFDPDVVAAFQTLAKDDAFWSTFEREDIRDQVLKIEPQSEWRAVGDERIDDVALAFADFIDLKSRYKAAHSRRVGAVAEQLARMLRCADEAVIQIRRAGFMHDIGVVGVASYTLDRPWRQLSESEKDDYRLHPYHAERILKRIPCLAPLAEMVGTHQERMDGSGFYRGLRGDDISLGARIIAVADRLDELTHSTPGTPALALPDAVEALSSEPLDREVLAALRRSLGEKPVSPAPAPSRPAALTEREVEVLRLMTRGLTRREIGKRLTISENTVRNHLDHIYDKTGTSNRVSATMFAMENGLLTS
jgi:HD-GYP domain-containing protein (c-di-GMP phosphodiesterase class II)